MRHSLVAIIGTVWVGAAIVVAACYHGARPPRRRLTVTDVSSCRRGDVVTDDRGGLYRVKSVHAPSTLIVVEENRG